MLLPTTQFFNWLTWNRCWVGTQCARRGINYCKPYCWTTFALKTLPKSGTSRWGGSRSNVVERQEISSEHNWAKLQIYLGCQKTWLEFIKLSQWANINYLSFLLSLFCTFTYVFMSLKFNQCLSILGLQRTWLEVFTSCCNQHVYKGFSFLVSSFPFMYFYNVYMDWNFKLLCLHL